MEEQGYILYVPK